MRDIRFRAWDKAEEAMIHDSDGEADFRFLNGKPIVKYLITRWKEGGGEIHEIDEWQEIDGVVMQYTGLKDKNGKEVYEGDILGQDCQMVDDYTGKQSIEVQKLVVRWSNEKAQWTVYCPGAMIRDDWGYIPRGAYVIGNIFQNPELIQCQQSTPA